MKLWQVWWLGGGALAAVSFALSRGAEHAFLAGHSTLSALLEVTRLVLFLIWFFAVWKYSRNVGHRAWTYLARIALIAGLVATAVLY